MKHKIAVIQPYFGKFPNYFSLSLKSLEYNSDFDWYIVTDDKTSHNYPKNVHVIYMTFDDLHKKIQKEFDFKVAFETPYKICDFRPCFGVIFKDLLDKYDFWGYFDPDVIFGDLKNYVNDNILSEYDKLFVKGHFSLYRNNDFINNLYKEKIDGCLYYKDVFTDNVSFIFDEKETDGINAFFVKSGLKLYDNREIIADIGIWNYSFIIAKPNEEEKLKAQNSCFSYENGKAFRYYYLDGNIHKEEFMYIHLQKRKMTINTENSSKYLIYDNSFNDFADISKEFLLNSNRNKYWYKKKDLLKYNIIVHRILPYYNIIVKQKKYGKILEFIQKKLKKG